MRKNCTGCVFHVLNGITQQVKEKTEKFSCFSKCVVPKNSQLDGIIFKNDSFYNTTTLFTVFHVCLKDNLTLGTEFGTKGQSPMGKGSQASQLFSRL